MKSFPSLFTKRNNQNSVPRKAAVLFLALTGITIASLSAQTTLQSDSLRVDSLTHDSNAFQLGEVVVKGEKETEINAVVDEKKLENFYRTDVSKALNLLPGVTLSSVGPRNEAMVYVRGFDLRQVPVLMDGIPVYVPYDGYVDLARFNTFDLAEVNVSKGYTSVLYGPNALGGAINMVSRRPTKKLELLGASGWMTGGYRTNLNVGTNLGKFYLQAGASQFKREYVMLSKNFNPSREDGGRRDNSYSEDTKYSLKVGFTPKGKSEYALSYLYQHGKKGTPVYTGSDVKNSQLKNPRYWQWPNWDKQSLYFISNTRIDSTQYLKTRLYYDVFRNLLNSYDDATYSAITKPYAFQSYYNDYTLGGIVEYGKNLFKGRDMFKATLQYKQDVHREHNEGEPERTMSDQVITAGFENELKIGARLLFLAGFSYNYRESIKAMNYNSTSKTTTDFPKNNNDAYNLQGALVYRVTTKHAVNIAVAKKTRFATVKDRYSYRLGTAIPNTDLNAEYAYNFELGYKGNLMKKITLQGALFYSHIYNTIQNVNNVHYDATKNTWLSQLQNTGQSEYLGAEFGADYSILHSIKTGANYTYLERHNLSNPAIHFTDVPYHKLFGFLQYQASDKFYVQVNSEYNTKRYSTSYGTVSNGFALVNTKASVKIWKFFSAEAGVNNIFDRNYTLVEGYPEMGRNYVVNLVYRY